MVTGRQMHDMQHSAVVTGLAIFPDGRRVLTGCSDGTTDIWDLETGLKLRENLVCLDPHDYGDGRGGVNIPGVNGVATISVSTDGRRALFGSSNFMLLWDLEMDEEWKRVELDGTVLDIAASPDGRYAVSSAGEAAVSGRCRQADSPERILRSWRSPRSFPT